MALVKKDMDEVVQEDPRRLREDRDEIIEHVIRPEPNKLIPPSADWPLLLKNYDKRKSSWWCLPFCPGLTPPLSPDPNDAFPAD
jgi:hypothetical protein